MTDPIADTADYRRAARRRVADGGVRSWLDILPLISLCEDGATIGPAGVSARGARGEDSVAHLLRLFMAKLETAMARTG